MKTPLATYSYQLDKGDCIIQLSDNWDAFARENDGTDFVREKIINLPLWDFIRDEGVINLLNALFHLIRTTASSLQLPMNCDSPDYRRSLELHISLLPQEGIMCSNHVLDITRRKIPVPLLDTTIERSDDFIRMCSWCKKIAVDDTWHDVERAIVDLGLFKAQQLPRVTHGICPACFEQCSKVPGL